MSEIYRFMGPEIKKHLTGLRPAQLEQLDTAFAEIDGDDGPGRMKNDVPKETITTNINPGGKPNAANAKGKKPTNAKGKPNNYDEDEENNYDGGAGPESGFGGGGGGAG